MLVLVLMLMLQVPCPCVCSLGLPKIGGCKQHAVSRIVERVVLLLSNAVAYRALIRLRLATLLTLLC